MSQKEKDRSRGEEEEEEPFETDPLGLKSVLRELEKSEVRIVVRVEERKFGKPVTVVQGLPKSKDDLQQVSKSLKSKLATGGTVKDGTILLQGDHREKVRQELQKLGYSSENIEVQ
jgi:translation initiation factor 1